MEKAGGRAWLIVFGVMIFLGCASTEEIYHQAKQVDVSDGVSVEEAKVIAKHQLVKSGDKKYYKITAPAIWQNEAALKYPGYWFVVFGHNWLSPISAEASKTYTELKETLYLTVIEKDGGKVVFTGEYYPKRSNNFDWIFHPEVYQTDPLNLPAGQPSQPARGL